MKMSRGTFVMPRGRVRLHASFAVSLSWGGWGFGQAWAEAEALQGNVEDASQLYTSAASQPHIPSGFLRAWADFESRSCNPKAAKRLYSLAVQRCPGDAKAALGLAELEREAGNPGTALKLLKQALLVKPRIAERRPDLLEDLIEAVREQQEVLERSSNGDSGEVGDGTWGSGKRVRRVQRWVPGHAPPFHSLAKASGVRLLHSGTA